MTSHTVIGVLPRSRSHPTTRGQAPITCQLFHATQQTHSAPGSGCVNFDKPMTTAGGKHLSGCAVCARSFWAEELFEMNLFTKPDNGLSLYIPIVKKIRTSEIYRKITKSCNTVDFLHNVGLDDPKLGTGRTRPRRP